MQRRPAATVRQAGPASSVTRVSDAGGQRARKLFSSLLRDARRPRLCAGLWQPAEPRLSLLPQLVRPAPSGGTAAWPAAARTAAPATPPRAPAAARPGWLASSARTVSPRLSVARFTTALSKVRDLAGCGMSRLTAKRQDGTFTGP